MDQAPSINYIPILLIFVMAAGLATVIIFLSRFVGRHRPTKEKLEPYECGVEPVGNARERQSVKFYLVAMVFLLFDIEIIFLVPWAVIFKGALNDPNYQPLRWVLYGEMMVFMVVLLAGLFYVWRKGILDWSK
ncbi:MAG: NADH-quinone oxidoreductase subunit A [Acidobacteria bacterium]|nr:NADH-quinone oxidoreductase subunit A [Acidobacteriota bacterium]